MKSSKDLLSAIQTLELPIPQEREFYCVKSLVLPLTRYGAVIRFTDKKEVPILRTDNVLRPIGAIDIDDDIRMDITPAGQLAHYFDSVAVQDNLDEQGIENMDVLGHERNCLYLPQTQSTEMKNGKPVCFDPLYLRNTNVNIREYTADRSGIYTLTPSADEEHDLQDRLYNDLCESFEDSIRAKMDEPEQKGVMTGFWNEMARATQDGRLIAAWAQKNTTANDCNISAIAQRYENHLSQDIGTTRQTQTKNSLDANLSL